MCKGARHFTMGRLIRVDPLDNSHGDGRASRSERTVACAHSRSTAAALTIWNNLDLVRHSILGAHVVGGGTRNLAVGRLVIYTLDSGDGNGRLRGIDTQAVGMGSAF